MKFVVDRNIRGAESTFGRHGELDVMDGRDIRAEHLANADALIIRTATRADRALLSDSAVGFVGTTSIGTDHLDIDWLDRQGIRWANAPGCNADSAAQYTLAMILLACERLNRKLAGQRVGIVGRGNVGSRVQRLLGAMGAATVANDPPLSDQGKRGLVSLEEALDQDIVSLHVPLETGGCYPTRRLISALQLARVPDGALIINTARGEVVDGEALYAELKSGRLHAALDVWPGEPEFSSALSEAVTVATPHVAGYSDDGKWNGTQAVYRAFCAWAGLSSPKPQGLPSDGPELVIPAGDDAVSAALEAACFVRFHDKAMRLLAPLDSASRVSGFDRLRKEYPPRRDFHAWQIRCRDSGQSQLLERLGFSVNQPGD